MRNERDDGGAPDPFRYGWRNVDHQRYGDWRIPLTLDDLLFPEEADQTPQSQSCTRNRFSLMEAFRRRQADVRDALILVDCRVRYDVAGLKPVGPDIAIFFDAPRGFNGATFDVTETKARPVMVVEITSPDTRIFDFGIKKRIYHRAGVPWYIILDSRPRSKNRRLALRGYRDSPDGYEPIPLDDRGRLWLEPLNLWLSNDGDRVICVDGETGEPIGDYSDQAEGRRAEYARAEAERARAEAEARRDLEARLRAMEEENRRLRGVTAAVASVSGAIALGWGDPGWMPRFPDRSRGLARVWEAARRPITWPWTWGPRAAEA